MSRQKEVKQFFSKNTPSAPCFAVHSKCNFSFQRDTLSLVQSNFQSNSAKHHFQCQPSSSTSTTALSNYSASTNVDNSMSQFFSEEHISKMRYEEKENERPASGDVNDMPIGNSIAEWATKYQISIVALSSLLLIFQLYKLKVPKHPRILLKTPLNYFVKHVAGGDYFYHGIKKGILSLLKQFGQSFPLTPILNLRINVDELAYYFLKIASCSYGLFWD